MAHIAPDGQWRFPIVQDLPEKYKQAIITFEDKDFYDHVGVSLKSMVRAMKQNIIAKRVVSGGSTLSMQVIRMSRQRTGKSLVDKVLEMFMALRLETKYNKNEILALHAAHAPFGGNVVGLEAASWRYFGHAPENLSWAEAATLAVLPNAPSLMHPGKNRKALMKKRNRLLHKLFVLGYLDEWDYAGSLREYLPNKPKSIPQITSHYMHLLIAQGRNGERIQTGIKMDVQKAANNIISRHYNKNKERQINNSGALILDVKTGKVLAYVGNTPCDDRSGKHVDLVQAPRSTGSILKPFLYAHAMQDAQLTPRMLVPDYPTRINGYAPKNYEDKYDGMVPASQALSRSLNIPAVRILSAYGVSKFKTDLENLGLTTLFRPADDYGLSLILGGAEATLWDLAHAYVKLSKTAQNEDVGSSLSPAVAFSILEAMSNVHRPADEQYWNRFEDKRKIAWKTGTSFGARDAWAIGVTDKYVVAVWAGNADGAGVAGMTGSNTAAPILFDLFQLLPQTRWFTKPNRNMRFVEVCSKSGHRAGQHCIEKKSVWFPRACLESAVCPYHRLINVTSVGGKIHRAFVDCLEENADLQQVSWFVLPPSAELYYKNFHPEYQTLPSLLPGCSVAEKHIEIIYPMAGSVIRLPRLLNGDLGESIFEAVHRQEREELFWYLDNHFVTTTQDIHQVPMQPSAGIHSLTVTDSRGNSFTRKFEVQISGGLSSL